MNLKEKDNNHFKISKSNSRGRQVVDVHPPYKETKMWKFTFKSADFYKVVYFSWGIQPNKNQVFRLLKLK